MTAIARRFTRCSAEATNAFGASFPFALAPAEVGSLNEYRLSSLDRGNGHQSQDRQGTRPDDPALDPRPGRRRYRVIAVPFKSASLRNLVPRCNRPLPILREGGFAGSRPCSTGAARGSLISLRRFL